MNNNNKTFECFKKNNSLENKHNIKTIKDYKMTI